MGGNFPAGTREGRDRREKKRNFNIRERPDRRIKIRRKPGEILKFRQDNLYIYNIWNNYWVY